MKYFCVSDLHGTSPKNLLKSLKESGFENFNENHKLVVAGDITDGIGDDNKLIEALKLFEINNQLIAIKGNHDDWTISHNAMNHVYLEEKNRNWLKTLKSQFENEHIKIAHGIYLKGMLNNFDFSYESTWGCPALFTHEAYDWWEIGKCIVEEIHKKWKNIDEYEEWLDKPLILGHFWPHMIKERIEAMIEFGSAKKEKFTIDEKGFVSYGKIHWVDSDVLHSHENKKIGEVFVKILEF